MDEMDFAKRQIALTLFEVGAFQDKRQSDEGKGFKLKLHEKDPQAPLSPIYLNLRTPDNPKPGPLTPGLVSLIGEVLYAAACRHELQYIRVAGVPRAGNPLAEAFSKAALLFGRPTKIPVLKLAKRECGESRQVVTILEGEYCKGDIVLLIDDLITKADSKFEAIGVLESRGLIVRDVLVLVDREQGGAQQLKKKGYNLWASFTLSGLLDLYLETHQIDQDLYEEIKTYLATSS